MLKLKHEIKGDNLLIRPSVSSFKGDKVFDGTIDDGQDEVTFEEGNKRKLATLRFDLDEYLTNARISRTDS